MTPMQTAQPDLVGADRPHSLAFDSDFSIYNAPEHRRRLLDALAHFDAIEVDLAHVAEIDCAGLQVLLLAKRESLATGKVMRIVAHSAPVQELLEFCNLASYFGDPLVISARAGA